MCTDFLFAQPRALFGVARTLDLAGQFDRYNVSRTPAEADARAIHSDWHMVGQDLREAFAAFAAEHADELEDPQLLLPLTTP